MCRPKAQSSILTVKNACWHYKIRPYHAPRLWQPFFSHNFCWASEVQNIYILSFILSREKWRWGREGWKWWQRSYRKWRRRTRSRRNPSRRRRRFRRWWTTKRQSTRRQKIKRIRIKRWGETKTFNPETFFYLRNFNS